MSGDPERQLKYGVKRRPAGRWCRSSGQCWRAGEKTMKRPRVPLPVTPRGAETARSYLILQGVPDLPVTGNLRSEKWSRNRHMSRHPLSPVSDSRLGRVPSPPSTISPVRRSSSVMENHCETQSTTSQRYHMGRGTRGLLGLSVRTIRGL